MITPIILLEYATAMALNNDMPYISVWKKLTYEEQTSLIYTYIITKENPLPRRYL